MSFIQKLLTGVNNLTFCSPDRVGYLIFQPTDYNLQGWPLELGTLTTEMSSYFKATEEELLKSIWNYKRIVF